MKLAGKIIFPRGGPRGTVYIQIVEIESRRRAQTTLTLDCVTDAPHGFRVQLHAALRAISVESTLHLSLGQYGCECGINACCVVELASAGATNFETATNHEMYIGDDFLG